MPPRRRLVGLYLMRVGDTPWDADGRIIGCTDLPLAEVGRSTVRHDAKCLPATGLSTVYHPPDEAATETARLIAAHLRRGRMRSVAELADPSLGVLEGLTRDQFADRFPKRHRQWEEDVMTVAPPDGDDLPDARRRAFKALARILKRSRAEAVGVVLHGFNLGLVRCWLAAQPTTVRWTGADRPDRVLHYVLSPGHIAALERDAAAAD